MFVDIAEPLIGAHGAQKTMIIASFSMSVLSWVRFRFVLTSLEATGQRPRTHRMESVMWGSSYSASRSIIAISRLLALVLGVVSIKLVA
jgi:hypothetical protein